MASRISGTSTNWDLGLKFIVNLVQVQGNQPYRAGYYVHGHEIYM
jgi:hypothetical protein